MRGRSVAVAFVSVVAFFAMSSGVSSAPAALTGPASSGELVTAVRLNPPKPQAPPPPPAPTPIDAVISLVNAERGARSLAPMVADGRLNLAAQLHSEDQAWRNLMTHTGSDGSTAGQRITAAGFVWRSYAENVAYGYGSADAVVAAWMNSSGHRANILSANTHIGVGLAYSAGGTPYWTLDVATPR